MDTPEAVVISCFDPIRGRSRKLPSVALISDGRIHPARIEEIVQKVYQGNRADNHLERRSERVLFEVGIPYDESEAIWTLGRLHYRYELGQKRACPFKGGRPYRGMIASEVGA